MPIDCPWYRPEPKSGCSGVVDPMKLMIAFEFGSSGALEMLVFQRLLVGKGMNPFKLAPCPRLIRLQGLICADTRDPRSRDRHFEGGCGLSSSQLAPRTGRGRMDSVGFRDAPAD